MKTVKVINMKTGKCFETWCTEKEARTLFCEYCDQFNIPYEPDVTEAGGIGFTHRVEIISEIEYVNAEIL